MKTKRQCILLASAALLAGCATRPAIYTKAGVTDAERRRDEAACIQQALGHQERTHIGLLYSIDREEFVKCLEGRGYSAARP